MLSGMEQQRLITDICVNFNKTRATLIYSVGPKVELYESSGNVLDLVIYMLAPKANYTVSLATYTNSLEDTASIELNQLETSK